MDTLVFGAVITLFILGGICGEATSEGAYEVKQKLVKELLQNYDTSFGPENTTVNVRFSLIFMEVNEPRSLLILHSWVMMHWDDSRLNYEEEKHENIKVFRIQQDEIWVPRPTLVNNADTNIEEANHKTQVLVYPRGQLYVPRIVFQIHCYFDLRFWPFDAQTCKFMLSGSGINFYVTDKDEEMELSDYTENVGWTLKHTSFKVHYDADSDRNETIKAWIHIHRNSSGLAATMVMPAISLIALILVNFWLPPRAMWRMILSLLGTLLSALYLQHLVKLHPQSGKSMPLLVQFFRDSLALVLLFIILTIICRHLEDYNEEKSPAWVYKLTNGWFGRMLCIRQQIKEGPNAISDEDCDAGYLIVSAKDQTSGRSTLTLLLDRIFFFVFSLFFAVYLLAFIFAFL